MPVSHARTPTPCTAPRSYFNAVFARLRNVTGHVIFYGVDYANSGHIKLANLVAVGGVAPPYLSKTGLSFAGGSALTHVDLPVLKTASKIDLGSCKVLEALSLGSLESIEGDFRLEYMGSTDAYTNVSMPALVDVGGEVNVASTYLSSFSTPMLETVGLAAKDKGQGKLYMNSIDFPPASKAVLAFPALKSVEGQLRFSDIQYLAGGALPELKSVGDQVYFYGLPAVSALDLPTLESVGGGFQVGNCAKVAAVNAPKLKSAGGTVSFNSCAELAAVRLPALATVGSSVSFSSCAELAAVRLPALATVREHFSIGSGLPQFQTLELRSSGQVTVGGFFVLYGKEQSDSYAKPKFNCGTISGKFNGQAPGTFQNGVRTGCYCKGATC